ncbi:MAG: DUF4334 domain-containing protein [Oscillatoriophycideae cyanobacterium NC_groundwater_1537_Pr4_S-0.65um_50_18]|nr:DUF4334 domain-containing protein [Oscillatoriophycideae cyanobacterium NC_groundwater_1537_Pr4_S-0.65um_50_18]
MGTLEKFDAMLRGGEISTEEALELFNGLEPVNLEFMMGRWRGCEVQTNHLLNHLLEVTGWYGKEFIDGDRVHPLLFLDGNNQVLKVSPNPLVVNLGLRLVGLFPALKQQAMKSVFRSMSWILKTEVSQARVRMMEYRQKVSATMIYDRLPIHDIFRRVDDNTVLGLMDFKGVPQPFFFVLKRDVAGSEQEI